jgi:hypothetical protein
VPSALPNVRPTAGPTSTPDHYVWLSLVAIKVVTRATSTKVSFSAALASVMAPETLNSLQDPTNSAGNSIRRSYEKAYYESVKKTGIMLSEIGFLKAEVSKPSSRKSNRLVSSLRAPLDDVDMGVDFSAFSVNNGNTLVENGRKADTTAFMGDEMFNGGETDFTAFAVGIIGNDGNRRRLQALVVSVILEVNIDMLDHPELEAGELYESVSVASAAINSSAFTAELKKELALAGLNITIDVSGLTVSAPVISNPEAPTFDPTAAPTGAKSNNDKQLSDLTIVGISLGCFGFVLMVGYLGYAAMVHNNKKIFISTPQTAPVQGVPKSDSRFSGENEMFSVADLIPVMTPPSSPQVFPSSAPPSPTLSTDVKGKPAISPLSLDQCEHGPLYHNSSVTPLPPIQNFSGKGIETGAGAGLTGFGSNEKIRPLNTSNSNPALPVFPESPSQTPMPGLKNKPLPPIGSFYGFPSEAIVPLSRDSSIHAEALYPMPLMPVSESNSGSQVFPEPSGLSIPMSNSQTISPISDTTPAVSTGLSAGVRVSPSTSRASTPPSSILIGGSAQVMPMDIYDSP